MARNETITVNQYSWTQLTNANITSATWQIHGANDVRIQGTAGEVEPTETEVGIIYGVKRTKQGEVSSRTLAVLWPGITATRLYARSISGNSKVFISHA